MLELVELDVEVVLVEVLVSGTVVLVLVDVVVLEVDVVVVDVLVEVDVVDVDVVLEVLELVEVVEVEVDVVVLEVDVVVVEVDVLVVVPDSTGVMEAMTEAKFFGGAAVVTCILVEAAGLIGPLLSKRLMSLPVARKVDPVPAAGAELPLPLTINTAQQLFKIGVSVVVILETAEAVLVVLLSGWAT